MNTFLEQLKNSFSADELLNLSQVDWPAGLKVLVLAPHSDDFDAVAVTLKQLYAKGAHLRLVVLCLDNGVEADFEPQTPQAEIRKREQLASLKLFGLSADMASFPETLCDETGQLTDCPENLELIKRVVAAENPDMVFLPHWNDTNSAHRIVAKMLRYSQAGHENFLTFYNHDPKTVEMQANAFMPFDESSANWKGELLRCHISQHTRNLRTRGHGFDERLLADNASSAETIGCQEKYAELFEVL